MHTSIRLWIRKVWTLDERQPKHSTMSTLSKDAIVDHAERSRVIAQCHPVMTRNFELSRLPTCIAVRVTVDVSELRAEASSACAKSCWEKCAQQCAILAPVQAGANENDIAPWLQFICLHNRAACPKLALDRECRNTTAHSRLHRASRYHWRWLLKIFLVRIPRFPPSWTIFIKDEFVERTTAHGLHCAIKRNDLSDAAKRIKANVDKRICYLTNGRVKRFIFL